MIRLLSNDKDRAGAVMCRYFNVDAEWWPMFKAAIVCYGVEKQMGKSLTLESPSISLAPGFNGVLLLSVHPDLGGGSVFVYPDSNPKQGYLSVKCSLPETSFQNLPYHFSIRIIPTGHL